MRIGFIGLGRMGANMVRRLVQHNHEVAIYNRTAEKTTELAKEHAGILPAYSIAELVGALEKPRAVWVMVPAGDATEAQIEDLLEVLEPGDLPLAAVHPARDDGRRPRREVGPCLRCGRAHGSLLRLVARRVRLTRRF